MSLIPNHKLNTNTARIKDEYESPCVRNCCLDSDDICMGCFRSINEITGWSSFSTEEKSVILSNCNIRKESQKKL